MEKALSFNRDIRPILSEHCFTCHGMDEKNRKAGLRLDERSAALRGGKSDGPAIVPGKPDQSALIQRITAHEDDGVMPPRRVKNPLSAKQIATLKQWIAAGAMYERHWAFEMPRKQAVPKNEHPIDFFVKRKLADVKLQPSPPADPATLCRRMYLDLVGLPPTPQQLDAFLQSYSRNRARAIVELMRSLASSPQYGERWARLWLDIARFADSNGFEKDLLREMWAWRAWVIQAFNSDMPYDRFIIEQLAGDLLRNPTQDQIVATGLLRNSMINEEGAIVPEQFRMFEIFDRMDCIGKATLGLSLQCAQCHSHKFDPISQDEYYGLFAFLNNTYEAQSWVYTREQQKTIDDIHARVKAANELVKKRCPEWHMEMAAWEKSVLAKEALWRPMKAIELASSGGLNHPTQEADFGILTQGHPTTSGDIFGVFIPDTKGATGLRLEALAHRDMPFAGPGRSKYGTWAVSELKVLFQRPGGKTWESLKLVNASADFSEPDGVIEDEWRTDADKTKKRVRGPVSYLIDGDEATGWRADRGPDLRNDYAAVLAMGAAPKDRSKKQTDVIFSAWVKTLTDAESRKTQEAIAAAWKNHPVGQTSVLHLAERLPHHARATTLLHRGEWDRPKQGVTPHVPALLHSLEKGEGSPTRHDFARWLVSKNNPLAARVAVNRVWQAIFGVGLVETAEDFGTRAPVPQYLDLLDWLAVDFMEHGWSHRHLIERIVTSDTYQQSAVVTPDRLERDPKNRLLSRGARFRMDAEVIRDTTLSIAGILHLKEVGGPSIFPPVPKSVLDDNFTKPTYWVPPEGPERYRRALYVVRKRSMPDPVMTSFDAPNADIACARRSRSNTPLSALTSLNEITFVEAAQALALRILKEGGKDDDARASYAFLLCTARPARNLEREEVLRLLRSSRERLQRGELQARPIAFSKFTKLDDLPVDATPNDIAAWTIVSRVLLNLDETLCRP
ncbi:MAG: PSD1 domain-containing protein [Planctomycetes bacterium]|nr:PSD1 domain-containing protein [Planctomycetota bacterium]